jgi:thymidine kinase
MSLHITIGPMYSGKTTRMLQKYANQLNINKIAIDYCIRPSTTDFNKNNDYVYHANLETHSGLVLPNVYKTKSLFSLKYKNAYNMFSKDVQEYYFNMFQDAEHIYINECQFFPDLKEFVIDMMKYNKNIYLYGLNGDFQQKMFGQTFELIPYATSVNVIQGKCSMCNNRSIISYRTTNRKEQYLTDASIYIPLCFTCLDEKENTVSV